MGYLAFVFDAGEEHVVVGLCVVLFIGLSDLDRVLEASCLGFEVYHAAGTWLVAAASDVLLQRQTFEFLG